MNIIKTAKGAFSSSQSQQAFFIGLGFVLTGMLWAFVEPQVDQFLSSFIPQSSAYIGLITGALALMAGYAFRTNFGKVSLGIMAFGWLRLAFAINDFAGSPVPIGDALQALGGVTV